MGEVNLLQPWRDVDHNPLLGLPPFYRWVSIWTRMSLLVCTLSTALPIQTNRHSPHAATTAAYYSHSILALLAWGGTVMSAYLWQGPADSSFCWQRGPWLQPWWWAAQGCRGCLARIKWIVSKCQLTQNQKHFFYHSITKVLKIRKLCLNTETLSLSFSISFGFIKR